MPTCRMSNALFVAQIDQGRQEKSWENPGVSRSNHLEAPRTSRLMTIPIGIERQTPIMELEFLRDEIGTSDKMAVSDDYIEYVVDQLADVGTVVPRRMFGGVGLYLKSVFFALIADNVLYMKVDESNRPDYEDAGMGPFMPFGDESHVMQYYEVPIDILEDRDRLADWARKAFAVAQKAKAGKTKSKKRKTRRGTKSK